MNNEVYIYHHLGLGDHFHCNGVVRFLINEKNNLYKKYEFIDKFDKFENNIKIYNLLNLQLIFFFNKIFFNYKTRVFLKI